LHRTSSGNKPEPGFLRCPVMAAKVVRAAARFSSASRDWAQNLARTERVKANLSSISDIKFTWLAEQLAYIVRGSGKGIRPALTLLSGRFYDYDLTKLMPMACAVELLHTATLVHDDAIDKSSVRRGNATINKLFGEDVAILMGDYLFAKAGEFVSDTQSPRAIKLFSQDPELLRAWAPKVGDTIKKIPGVVDVLDGIENTISDRLVSQRAAGGYPGR
jgi:hypothetical protein